MAENPPLSNTGIPLRVDGEYFVLDRKNVEIEIVIPNVKKFGKRSATGKVKN